MTLSLAAIAMVAQTALAMPQSAALQPRATTACVSNTIDKLVVTGQNGTMVIDCGSAFEILAIQSVPATGLHARCTDPRTVSLKQTRIVESGTWWDVWTQDSGCAYCGLSSGQCDEAINWADTTSATFNVGFDMSTQDKVLSLIQGNAGFNLGYSWGYSFTKGGTWTCHIPASSVGRLYVQNQKGWADSQVRYGSSTTGCGGNGLQWDSWTASMRSNWALNGDNTVNHGCSTGVSAHC